MRKGEEWGEGCEGRGGVVVEGVSMQRGGREGGMGNREEEGGKGREGGRERYDNKVESAHI